MKLGLGLYVKNSVEAVNTYSDAFGLELGYNVKNKDGSFYHSELNKNGTEIFDVIEKIDATNLSKTVQKNVQIAITLDSVKEVEHAFNVLSKDGTVDTPLGSLPWSDCAFSVIDKFGIWWYVTVPGHYPDENFSI